MYIRNVVHSDAYIYILIVQSPYTLYIAGKFDRGLNLMTLWLTMLASN